MKKKIVTYGLIIVVLFGGIFFLTKTKKTRPIMVKTASVEKGDVKAYISTTGTVESQTSEQYYGLQTKVDKVNVSVGDKVKKGQALVVYDISDYTSSYNQAKLQYSNAILQRDDLYNQSKTINDKVADLDRQINELDNSMNLEDMAKVESLKNQKDAITTISTEKLKQADNAVVLAKLSLDSAKQKVQENKSKIVSGINGTVTVVNAVQGTVGSTMQPAVEVEDIENLKAVTSLGKYDANNVELGQAVIINNGDKTYQGRVSAIGPVATQAATGGDASLAVDIDILNKAPKLKVDFDVDVDILIGQVRNAINIPAECLKIEKGDRNLVYVLDGETVHEKAVKVGLRSDTDVEILSGLSVGEKVILNPSTSISEGVKAKGE